VFFGGNELKAGDIYWIWKVHFRRVCQELCVSFPRALQNI